MFFIVKSDYRTSHDIEEIIYAIDNRLNIVNEIKEANNEVRNFINSELNKIISQDLLNEVLISHTHPIMLGQRMPIVLEKIDTILNN